MRKKKDKHGDPSFTKNTATYKRQQRSQSHHSIVQKHEERLLEFKRKDDRVRTLDTRIKSYKKDIEKLTKDIALKTINQDVSRNENCDIYKLQIEMQDLVVQKGLIESGEEEMNYMLESAHLVMRYIDLDTREAELLNDDDEDNMDALNDIATKKNEIADEYLSKHDPNYVNTRRVFDKKMSICPDCDIHYELASGFLVCPICGLCVNNVETAVDLSFKEMQDYDYRPQFTYNKETHLEDWLRRFQAKEHKVIPQEVLDKVVIEAKKARIRDLTTLSEDVVKRFLKKLDLNEYYDNVINIINRINGRKPFTLTTEIEDKIKVMFQQIQVPFEKFKPPKRKNFLSYSYTLHKFFQILGLHEFAKYFPLLKSPDKLRQQDDIFKKIVEFMAEKDHTVNWVFYPSI